jgi:site-specific DNA-methyltransferase (adenine-specific)
VDALEALPLLPDGCVDLVLTSIPYNVGLEYEGGFTDNMTEEEHEKWLLNLCAETCRAMGDPSRAYWIVSDPLAFTLRRIMPIDFVQLLTWCKPNLAGGSKIANDWVCATEQVMLFRKGKRTPMLSCDGVNTHSYMVITSPQRNFRVEQKVHIAQFPIRLPYSLIGRTPGDIILDPFAGSGTTGIAAHMLGRQFLGFEINQEYCDIANKRIQAAEKGITVNELSAGQGTLWESGSEGGNE